MKQQELFPPDMTLTIVESQSWNVLVDKNTISGFSLNFETYESILHYGGHAPNNIMPKQFAHIDFDFICNNNLNLKAFVEQFVNYMKNQIKMCMVFRTESKTYLAHDVMFFSASLNQEHNSEYISVTVKSPEVEIF